MPQGIKLNLAFNNCGTKYVWSEFFHAVEYVPETLK